MQTFQDHLMKEVPIGAEPYIIGEMIDMRALKLTEKIDLTTRYRIPIVYTVQYKFDDSNAMITDAFLQEQTRVLNGDFTASGDDISQVAPEFKNLIGNCQCEFYIKTIRRVKVTGVEEFTSFTQFWDTVVGGTPSLEPLKNVNIMFTDLMNYAGGQAVIPTSSTVGQYFDGSLVRIGSVGTRPGLAGYRIATHELGHNWNLWHTFMRGCVAPGDEVDDTPYCEQTGGSTPTTTCGTPDNNDNHMSYNDKRKMYTLGQVERMRLALQTYRSQLISQAPGNQSPLVSITSPANGARFTPPAIITITATASDPDGTVSKVEFFNGTTLLSSDTSLPYSFAWNNVPVGNYNIIARVTDNLGATSESSVNVVVGSSVNTPPTCSITSPTNGQQFAVRAPVAITATASDNDGTVSKVEIYLNNSLLAPISRAPYTLTLFPEIPGTYSVKAKAYDNQNAVTESQAISFTVVSGTNTPPVVAMTTPANGATFQAPASIDLTATASDNGSISKVEFYRDSILLGSDTLSPYLFTWNNVPAGTYKLTAKAYDNQGLATVSLPITITVTEQVSDSPIVSSVLKADGKLKFISQDGRIKIVS